MTKINTQKPTRAERADTLVCYEIALMTYGGKDLFEGEVISTVMEGAENAISRLGGRILQKELTPYSFWGRVSAPSTIAPLTVVSKLKSVTTNAVKAAGGARIIWGAGSYLRTVSPSADTSRDLQSWLLETAGFSRTAIEDYYAGIAADALASVPVEVLTPDEAAEQEGLNPTDLAPAEVSAPVATPEVASTTIKKPRVIRAKRTKRITQTLKAA